MSKASFLYRQAPTSSTVSRRDGLGDLARQQASIDTTRSVADADLDASRRMRLSRIFASIRRYARSVRICSGKIKFIRGDQFELA
jgi:hypothetical protein